jgi:pyruvate dehydrogenase E1 component alpha subunit
MTDDLSISIYKTLRLNRMLDAKILSLQRQGRLGPYIASTGEEGAIVGSAYALNKDDRLFTSYRELGAHIVRGLSIDLILAQLFGNSNDLLKGRQMSNSWGSQSLNDVPTAAPIGAYLPVAVGTSMASKIKGDHIGVLTYFGDGATSSSDFHVAMNFAGVYKAPIVFFCRNNGWAISVPLTKQTASKTIVIKALAYGFDGVRVDGNDALACYALTSWALEKARKGGGPILIEAVTYRIGPHSTSDDPKRYRDEDDLKSVSYRDPISLLKSYLTNRKLWNDKNESNLVSEYERMISDAIERQELTSPLPPQKLIFEDVYSEMPWNLREQRNEI